MLERCTELQVIPGFHVWWWPIGSATLGFEGEYPFTH